MSLVFLDLKTVVLRYEGNESKSAISLTAAERLPNLPVVTFDK